VVGDNLDAAEVGVRAIADVKSVAEFRDGDERTGGRKRRAKCGKRVGVYGGEFLGPSLLLPKDERPPSIRAHALIHWARLRARVRQEIAQRVEGGGEIEAIGQAPVCGPAGLFHPATPAVGQPASERAPDELDKLN